MRKFGEIAFVFLIGCFLYSLIEIASRGYTHWSMTLTGGVCLVYIYHLATDTNMNIILKCLCGALFITSAEFIVGIAVNLVMEWNVWDYSDIPTNLMGQICLPYSFIWFMLCFVGCGISRIIKNKFLEIYDEEKNYNELTHPIFCPQEKL